jgi:hypothetical protein
VAPPGLLLTPHLLPIGRVTHSRALLLRLVHPTQRALARCTAYGDCRHSALALNGAELHWFHAAVRALVSALHLSTSVSPTARVYAAATALSWRRPHTHTRKCARAADANGGTVPERHAVTRRGEGSCGGGKGGGDCGGGKRGGADNSTKRQTRRR